MELIRTFFTLNRDVVYFAYGLVFFILGLAIALQSRNYSRLDLARSLKWLAAFGFSHGFHEWGDLFIPIQSAYLSPGTISLLHHIHLILLALSFAFLFEFGASLLRPIGRGKILQGVSGGLFAIWVFITFFPLTRIFPHEETWYNVANALSRYFIGFPGAMLAAYGLRQHAFARIVPLNVPDIVRVLQVGGILMGFYAVLGGLVPPAIPFFPGNIINTESLEFLLGIPVPVYRSLIGLGLAIAVIRTLEIFDVEIDRMIEGMEQRQILISERNRIARELHDGAIQKVYTAGLLVESAQKIVETTNPSLSERLVKAELVLNDAIHDLRRNLGELQTTPVAESFQESLRKIAQDPSFQSFVEIKLRVELPATEEPSPWQANHILSIVNEALSNVVKHSHARNVLITVDCRDGRLLLKIQDDGTGLPKEPQLGYGLRNMRDRAKLLGGNIEMNGEGKGTLIRLDIPWKEER
jgi:signal transduction histidine kinase